MPRPSTRASRVLTGGVLVAIAIGIATNVTAQVPPIFSTPQPTAAPTPTPQPTAAPTDDPRPSPTPTPEPGLFPPDPATPGPDETPGPSASPGSSPEAPASGAGVGSIVPGVPSGVQVPILKRTPARNTVKLVRILEQVT